MTRRLRTLATNPTDKGDGKDLSYFALEHVESRTGRLAEGAVIGDRDSSDAVPVQPGDVLFGKLRPYLAKVLRVEEQGCASPELLAIRPGPELDSRYLYYICLSKPFLDWADASSYGVKMPRTSWDLLSTYRPHLPRLPEQQRIADHLDAQCARVDELVEALDCQRRLVDERSRVAQADMCARGLVDAPQAATELDWLPAIPSHWSIERLKHVAKLESGHTPSRSREELWRDCTVPWISLNDVGAMATAEFLSETTNKISYAGLAESSARVLPAGTVVLSRDATVGRCSIMAVEMATSQHFAAWICSPRIDPRYLWLVFTTVMQQHLDSLTDGATIRTIGMGDLRSCRVPVPPVGEQLAIVRKADQVRGRAEAAVRALEEQVALLREHRQALITAAVTGQFDVSSAA